MMSDKPDSTLASAFASSPNHGARAHGRAPNCLVLHYTGMASGEAALAHLRKSEAQVSCHYFIWEDGRIDQLVREERRAWHAGASCWKGERDINSSSIGIEIVNAGHPGGLPLFPPAQMGAVAVLCRDIAARHGIPPERVLAHSDIAPGRKVDPGENFPWAWLATQGVGVWPDDVAPAANAPLLASAPLLEGDCGERVSEWRESLARWGYDIAPGDTFDAHTRVVVEAFQRHFRPARVDGVADAETQGVLSALLRGFGDRPV